jgi:hypothetical protein
MPIHWPHVDVYRRRRCIAAITFYLHHLKMNVGAHSQRHKWCRLNYASVPMTTRSNRCVTVRITSLVRSPRKSFCTNRATMPQRGPRSFKRPSNIRDEDPEALSRWSLQRTPTAGFGSAYHATSWTTNIDECKWLDALCDANGQVTALLLAKKYIRGQIPHDLGPLTDLTSLSWSVNQLSASILSSLDALTAMTIL